jgi:hypothetical protein
LRKQGIPLLETTVVGALAGSPTYGAVYGLPTPIPASSGLQLYRHGDREKVGTGRWISSVSSGN